MAFCSAMNNYTLNEKNNISLSVEGCSDNQCLGLVALYNSSVGKRGKDAKVNNHEIIDKLYDFVINNINKITDENKKKMYVVYLVKLIFLVRDHYEGNGERDIFYTLFNKLFKSYPKICINSLHLLTGGHNIYKLDSTLEDTKPYGSFLDLNKLYMLNIITNNKESNELCNYLLDYYIGCIKKDIQETYPSLAVKWLPREKKKEHKMAIDLVNKLFNDKTIGDNSNLNIKFKKYRKIVKDLSDKIVIIEQLMTQNKWDIIEVKNIPSKALNKYMYAFKNEIKKTGNLRHPDDMKRMELRRKMLCELNKSSDSTRLNVKALQPYEIVKSVITNGIRELESETENINAMWNKYVYEFEKKIKMNTDLEKNLNMLILADVSGSMYGTPLEACIALSLLLTNMLNDHWKNKILTFESVPQWYNIPEHLNIVEKIRYLKSAPWGGSTNIGMALDMILAVAIKNNLSKQDMPSKMIIFSDMQFDQACSPQDIFKTGFEQIESKFKLAGYDLPHIIFWNLRGNTNGYNNKSSQKGTTMLSGFGPASFKSFMDGNFNINNSPWQTLKNLLESDRLNKLDSIIDASY